MLLRFNPIYLWWKDLHKPTVYSIFALLLISIFAVFSASYQVGRVIEVSSLQYFNKHIIHIILALFCFFFFAVQNTDSLLQTSLVAFFICLLLLICTLFGSGHLAKGAERWIDLKFIKVQPSELLKPFFIVISAHIFYHFEKTKNYGIIALYGFILLIILAILFKQPDFGMVVTYLLVASLVLFFSKIPLKLWLGFGLIFLLIVALAFFSMPHVNKRIKNFINGKEGYQTELAQKAIAEGGLLGKGLGMGESSSRLPESHNDFIFSRIGEEFGMLALIVIIVLYAYLTFSNLVFVWKENQIFGENSPLLKGKMFEDYERTAIVNNIIILLTVCLIAFEAFFNIAVNLGVVPPKGMILPFISYGGSALIGHGILAGVLCCANRRRYYFFAHNYSIR